MTTLNFNIGVLGHVDSGKTSLAKALSTVASTACFDKNPQSKERGITLDLGFSSFTLDAAEHIKQQGQFDFVQYTLVDCPGHASLIKTIIGGAQIIDMMFLVIDIVKGIQTQTAECLIIGEICCDKMLVILNKLDLIEESKRESAIEKITKRLHKTLENTKFANCAIVAVAANQQSSENESEKENISEMAANLSLKSNQQAQKQNNFKMLNIDVLVNKLKESTFLPQRTKQKEAFLLAVDHCFNIKGQGTVLTGTVLNGEVKINDTIEIPILKEQKKVKSIQVFRKPVEKASQGDRCGVCISNFDAKLFERGVVCTPSYVKTAHAVIIKVNKIKHFKGKITSGSKFHITVGHETILAKLELFVESNSQAEKLTCDQEGFDFGKEYEHVDEYDATTNEGDKKNYYALIDASYESSDHHQANGFLCVLNNLLIGSKLDTDIHLNQCRIAFYGRVLHMFSNKDFKEQRPSVQLDTAKTNSYLSDLKVYKLKSKEGSVERVHDEYTVIVRSLFKKETNIDLFVGLKVKLSTGEHGTIEGSFGQSGKLKVRLPNGLNQETKQKFDSKKNKKKSEKAVAPDETLQQPSDNEVKVFLEFKRYIHDDKKKLIQ